MSHKKQRRGKSTQPSDTIAHPETVFRRRTLAACIGLIALVLVVYARVATFPFINYDDQIYVTQNPEVLNGLSPGGIRWVFQATRASNWHPLTWVSHMTDATLFYSPSSPFKQWAGGHHLVNVAIHAGNSVLLFLLLFRMTAAWGRSVVVAMLFAVHPLHVESVAWVAERKDVLSTLFWLLTTLAYLASLDAPNSRTKRWVVPLCLAMGLMVKPMLVTLPFALLLLDFWPLGRFERAKGNQKPSSRQAAFRQLVLRKVPLFALVVVSSIVTYLVQRSGGAMTLGTHIALPERLANAVVASVAYLAKMIWPVDLAVFYPHPLGFPPMAQFLPALLVVVVLSAITILKIRRFPYLFVGWFWYLGTLVPVIGIVQVGMQSMADRYTYVPSIGIFVAITWGGAALLDHWHVAVKLRLVTLAMLCAVLVTLSVHQVGYWSSSERLFVHALEVTDPASNYVAHQQLAVTLLESHRAEEALEHFEFAMKLAPQAHEPREGAAQALLGLGRAHDAAMQYRSLLDMQPDDVAVANNLAWLLATSSDPGVRNGTEAVALAEQVVHRSDGRTAPFLDTLAAAYAGAGRFDEAIAAAIEARNLAISAADRGLARDIARRLASYRAGQPLRE